MKYSRFPMKAKSGLVMVIAIAFFSLLFLLHRPQTGKGSTVPSWGNSQTMALLEVSGNSQKSYGQGGADPLSMADGSALESQTGPQGTTADILDRKPTVDDITTYTVRNDDTVASIAKMFEVSSNTIRYVNDLNHSSTITPGQKLVIMPSDALEHTIAKGDTISGIAKKYRADIQEIKQFNNIASDTELVVGQKIAVPGGEPVVVVPKKIVAKKTSSSTSSKQVTTKNTSSSGYYADPMRGNARLSQKAHGSFGGIDLAAPIGTPVYASAAGKVVVSQSGGWGGGYGTYTIIQHNNGSKTLYAHNSSLTVSVGQSVGQGELIGYSGNTGRSTGPHLHFEMRNSGMNPPYSAWGY